MIYFVVYYIITITGEKFVKDGAWPAFLGIWLSSFILFPIAIFLTYKSTNDSALFNAEAYKKRLEPIVRLYQKIKAFLQRNKNQTQYHGQKTE